jgi:hypothetical protein
MEVFVLGLDSPDAGEEIVATILDISRFLTYKTISSQLFFDNLAQQDSVAIGILKEFKVLLFPW